MDETITFGREKIASAVAGFIFTVAVPGIIFAMIPKIDPSLGWPALEFSILLGITVLVWGFSPHHLKDWRSKMGSVAIMGIALVAYCIGAIWYYRTHVQSENGSSAEPSRFTWTWEPLSQKEADAIYRELKQYDKQGIQITCTSSTCSELANSLSDLFANRLGWNIINYNRQVIRSYADGVTGLVLNNSDVGSQQIKAAIEKNTAIRVRFGLPNNTPGQRPNIDHLIIVIGGKIPPHPIPPDMQKAFLELGNGLKQLSDDLATFVLDRQREQTRLPPIETNPSDLNSVRRNWDRSRDFSNETSILLQNRYGPRIIEALAELDT